MPLVANIQKALKPAVTKQIISLTPSAVNRIKQLQLGAQKAKPGLNQTLKVSVINKGCSGLQYTMDMVTKKEKYDEEINQDGARLIVDSKAVFTIIGSELDYVKDKLSSKFVFKNPNIKESCSCGQSFSV
ncbi:iron-sulfur cluster assembly 1-like protein [Neocallimastix lanati (nom. inval.)]|uniref:Iron-sulfur cluster assembly 1-like protein n=1 Tax=Neocallimastix californiae TaxID=1754190 RepID=A0A1Y2EWS1_9FUNG|nr:iron-sulfur cluster assembly 1-like protein [Neocallimastix sp. JGI-2020a]ORY75275.1 iron-sulfur cluster assembly 1-like protein [Neocallimastix californiae]|eukprot:ORY75275.1 iron-sulfur cluster assembly 1-like protein [Neocallimastix californiae]